MGLWGMMDLAVGHLFSTANNVQPGVLFGIGLKLFVIAV